MDLGYYQYEVVSQKERDKQLRDPNMVVEGTGHSDEDCGTLYKTILDYGKTLH